MMIIRQIERLWNEQKHQRLFGELAACRPETSARLQFESGWALPAAAMALIRLDEYERGASAFASQLIRTIVAGQEADGGWGDLMTTAVCLRALSLSHGRGEAIDRGIKYLANLQQPSGIWPRVPIRRMPEDAYVSAFVMFQLIDCRTFHETVQFDQAVEWFTKNAGALDNETKMLWDFLRRRCRPVPTPERRRSMAGAHGGPLLVWS
jgi:hypothetical protein